METFFTLLILVLFAYGVYRGIWWFLHYECGPSGLDIVNEILAETRSYNSPRGEYLKSPRDEYLKASVDHATSVLQSSREKLSREYGELLLFDGRAREARLVFDREWLRVKAMINARYGNKVLTSALENIGLTSTE